MTLLELCDPLFQYICRFNRSARKGGHHDLAHVRAEIKALMADMRAKASQTPGLLAQYEKVRLPLIGFVDFVIKTSPLPSAGEWQEIAFEEKELSMDDKFWDLLDETLADRSPSADERLAVFYTCIGLGFTGFYQGQPEYLRKKMMECAGRIRGLIDTDQSARVCPEAYENVDLSNLVEPPSASLMGIGIVLLGLVLVLFIANAYLYHDSSKELTTALEKIVSTTK